jgi:hypothetical protein
VHTVAKNSERHFRAGLSAQFVLHIVELLAGNRLAVDRQDEVARLDSRL